MNTCFETKIIDGKKVSLLKAGTLLIVKGVPSRVVKALMKVDGRIVYQAESFNGLDNHRFYDEKDVHENYLSEITDVPATKLSIDKSTTIFDFISATTAYHTEVLSIFIQSNMGLFVSHGYVDAISTEDVELFWAKCEKEGVVDNNMLECKLYIMDMLYWYYDAIYEYCLSNAENNA